MSESAAADGPQYLALKRAAELIASEDAFLTADQMLERLKQAVFCGEFDAPVRERTKPGREYLRIAVVIPKCEMTEIERALKTRVTRYYEMNRDSIASVIYCEGGLPGEQGLLHQWIYDPAQRSEVFNHLTATPLSDFPETGRRMIGDIRISRTRIAKWLAINGYPAPPILRELGDIRLTIEGAATEIPETIIRKKEQGRPELPGWRIVREHIVILRDADPEKPYKVLAHEARQEALKHCDELDVPSENTILRRMKEILNN
ncbi:hypothetical protein [Hyphococcus sp.]|uniref:hypothetical protein n=1 Tax=Hyphococcus sp. TaxID=2038636 RepID=UPI0035C73D7A